MRRDQTLHEDLIPFLCRRLGIRNYLEFGCHENETVGKVRNVCGMQIGIHAVDAREPSFMVAGVRYHIMDTQTFCKEVAAKYAPYDMVFIDADHSADAANDDFLGILKYVSPEGLILLHDTNPETVEDTKPGLCGDSWRLPRIFRDMNYECVTLPYHPGLTIFRNRRSYGPAYLDS